MKFLRLMDGWTLTVTRQTPRHKCKCLQKVRSQREGCRYIGVRTKHITSKASSQPGCFPPGEKTTSSRSKTNKDVTAEPAMAHTYAICLLSRISTPHIVKETFLVTAFGQFRLARTRSHSVSTYGGHQVLYSHQKHRPRFLG